MSERLIIHIGMHKTGSSSIQRVLSRNRLLLRAFGVHYPVSFTVEGRRESKHGALFSAISHEADHGEPHLKFGTAADQIDSLRMRIHSAKARRHILSSEGLSGQRPVFAEALAPLAKHLDTTVVVFVRRPDHWVESFYKQMVLSREVRCTAPFETFLADPWTQAHLDFPRIIGWWASAFGEDAIRLGVYEPGSSSTPFEAFLDAADLPRALRRLPHARARVNESPSTDVVEEVRRRNANGEESDVRSLPRGGGGSYFSPDERSAFLEARIDSLNALSRYHHSRTAGSLFAKPGST